MHKIIQNIFETIVEQAPFAIEDLMNELDTQRSGEGEKAADGGDGDASDGGDGDDGDASDGGDDDDGDTSDGDDDSASDGDDGDASDGDDGGASNENDDDSDESSEDEQDLQDTPAEKQPAGEGPQPVLEFCRLIATVSWLFSPEPCIA